MGKWKFWGGCTHQLVMGFLSENNEVCFEIVRRKWNLVPNVTGADSYYSAGGARLGQCWPEEEADRISIGSKLGYEFLLPCSSSQLSLQTHLGDTVGLVLGCHNKVTYNLFVGGGSCLEFVNNTATVKHNETRYACIDEAQQGKVEMWFAGSYHKAV